jgi:hypothetical protein
MTEVETMARYVYAVAVPFEIIGLSFGYWLMLQGFWILRFSDTHAVRALLFVASAASVVVGVSVLVLWVVVRSL